MADKKKPDETDNEEPTIVGGPVPVPVEIDHAVAYGRGHEVHWERGTDDEKEER